MRGKIVHVLAALWLVPFAVSFAMFLTTAPTGDSFTRGLNRITVFLTWQGAAFVVAMLAGLATWQVGANGGKNIKVIGYAPLAVSALLVATLVAIIGYTVLVNPDI